MSLELTTRSLDLKRLRDEGFEVEIHGEYLVIHHVPYLNSKKEFIYGSLVTELTLVDPTLAGSPRDHTVHLIGELPCDIDGNKLSFVNNSNGSILGDIHVNHYLSSAPDSGKYNDYYDKINTYYKLLSSPAQFFDKSVTAKTFKVIKQIEPDSVFNYLDTNSSRANISQLNLKFKGQKIGIIGLGGTGSYILDLISKNQVDEILLFDDDKFEVHNAYRSPGAASVEQLNMHFKKVDYYYSIYSKMHKFIKPNAIRISDKNIELLRGLTFVFICIDSNYGRGLIIPKLIEMGIPFIDVGIGIEKVEDKLIGAVRITTGTSDKSDHIEKRVGYIDGDENDYRANIQIADLNALNAQLAVIKWKKLLKFYGDEIEEFNSIYCINTSQLTRDDIRS